MLEDAADQRTCYLEIGVALIMAETVIYKLKIITVKDAKGKFKIRIRIIHLFLQFCNGSAIPCLVSYGSQGIHIDLSVQIIDMFPGMGCQLSEGIG